MNKKQFKMFLAKNSINQKEFAAMIGVNQNTITNYIRKGKFPLVVRIAIEFINMGDAIHNIDIDDISYPSDVESAIGLLREIKRLI